MNLYHVYALLLAIFAANLISTTDQELKILWLSSKYHFGRLLRTGVNYSLAQIFGGLSFALDAIIQNETHLLPGYDIQLRFGDEMCSSKVALGLLVDNIEDSYMPDLLLGTSCTSALTSTGLLTSLLNIPTFSWASFYLLDKSQYTSVIRVFYTVDSYGECITALLERFRWKRFSIISATGYSFESLAISIYDITRKRIEDVLIVWRAGASWGASPAEIQSFYQPLKQTVRVILLIVPETDLMRWMIGAIEEEMDGGDYVFVYVTLLSQNSIVIDTITTSHFWSNNDTDDEALRRVLQNLLVLGYEEVNETISDSFLERFNQSQYTSTWSHMINHTVSPPVQPYMSLYLYDTIMLYATLAMETMANNGSAMLQLTRNRIFQGEATGTLYMDDVGDRIGYFSLFSLQSSDRFSIIANTRKKENASNTVQELVFSSAPVWGDGRTGIANAPLDVPRCGFYGENCVIDESTLEILIVLCSVIFVAVILLLFAAYFFRNYVALRKVRHWRVKYEQVLDHKHSQARLLGSTTRSEGSAAFPRYCDVAQYQGVSVTVKQVKKASIDMTEEQTKELLKLLSLNHPNVNVFMGACIDSPNICVLWEYGSKGSVHDVISNDIITNMGDSVKFSITIDMLQGLQYLHDYFGCHGNLKSSNVVIDGRWTAKLTDFGLSLFLKGQEINAELDDFYRSLYWTAPEILLQESTGLKSATEITPESIQKTETADMYSVGVIMKEIFCRNEPFEEEEDQGIPPKDIMDNVLSRKNYRPSLENIERMKDNSSKKTLLVTTLIRSCWHPDINVRPTASLALDRCTKIQNRKNYSILDTMIENLEIYTHDLEKRVEAENMALMEEFVKVDDLLLKMLPRSVMTNLKRGITWQAEEFVSVTLLFSDIIGFSDPIFHRSVTEIVSMLNEAHSLIDSIIKSYEVYKIETVGDTYMLSSGVPYRNGGAHIHNITDCALHVIAVLFKEKMEKLQLRIGINTGPVVAGVIGTSVPRYCLFGDTVNTAHRLMTSAKAMRIQLSGLAFEALSKYNGYYVADRGLIQIKGKGFMHTYWLYDKQYFSVPLPSLREQFGDEAENLNILPITKGEKKTDRRQSKKSIGSNITTYRKKSESPSLSTQYSSPRWQYRVSDTSVYGQVFGAQTSSFSGLQRKGSKKPSISTDQHIIPENPQPYSTPEDYQL